jgi:hypothetical protein
MLLAGWVVAYWLMISICWRTLSWLSAEDVGRTHGIDAA